MGNDRFSCKEQQNRILTVPRNSAHSGLDHLRIQSGPGCVSMSRYESAVDRVVGIIPDYEYYAFGMEDSPELSTRGFAKSVLMPGHMLADIYEGNAEAILYGEQALSTSAGILFIQYGLTGKVSERALYGIMKAGKRAPQTILAFEIGYQVRDAIAMHEGKEPKSVAGRLIYGTTLKLTKSKKTGKDLRSFRFMERN